MSHPSDLVLEQYLHGEPVSPSVARHLETCDDCWRRWEHLHADEGLAPPVRAVLPEPANSPNWAWFAAGVGVSAAVAAAVLLTVGNSDAAATVVQLEQEVASLRSELRELTNNERLMPKGAAVGKMSSGSASGELRTAKKELGSNTSALPEGDQSAVPESSVGASKGRTAADKLSSSPLTEEERLTRLQLAMNKHSDVLLNRLDQWLDDMVDTTKIDEPAAQKIVDLIQYELVETTNLKADAKLGHLTGMEAREDWGILRQETNAALLDVLGDEQLVNELRAVTDAKK